MDAAKQLAYIGADESSLPEVWNEDGARVVPIRNVEGKTFVFDGKRYVDSAWDEKAEPRKVVAFSDAYFELLQQHPELAPYLTLGESVLVVFDGKVIEITPPPAE